MPSALALSNQFGLDRLELVEHPTREPGTGEVRLRMRAASLNYRDLLMITGRYNPKQRLPLIPLSDGLGEVLAVGEGVRDVAVGDRVLPIFAQRFHSGEPTREKLSSTLGGPLDGVLREELVLPAEGVVLAPDSLSDAECASLPCAALTAWNAVVEQGGLVAGQTVLVQGSGGVSIFALQFAKSIGARVIATTSSEAKAERLRELGADEVLDYVRRPAWGKDVLRLTGDRGVDLVIEVGGASTLAESVRAVRPGGTIAVIGMLGGGTGEVNLVPILMRNVRLQGVFVGHRESMERMVRAVDALRLRPVIDRVFPWRQARSAFELLQSGAHFGKVALSFE